MAVAAGTKYASVEIDTGDRTPIRDDEPVWSLRRAQDRFAVPAIEAYKILCEAGGSPPEHFAAVQTSIEEMKDWQRQNPESVKTPD